jgi:hypothetical protein
LLNAQTAIVREDRLKIPFHQGIRISSSYQNAIVIIDGVVSEKSQVDALKDIDADQIAKMSVLRGKMLWLNTGGKGKMDL